MYLSDRRLLDVLLAMQIVTGLDGRDRMIKEHGNITNIFKNIIARRVKRHVCIFVNHVKKKRLENHCG